MDYLRRSVLVLGVAMACFLGMATTANAYNSAWRGGWGWRGSYGHGYYGHGYRGGWGLNTRYGWGGTRWGIGIGLGYYGGGWGYPYRSYYGLGWGSPYRPYYGLGWGGYMNYPYQSYYAGLAYDPWPGIAYSYYAPRSVVIDAAPPVIIGSNFPANVQPEQPAPVDGAERLPAPSRDDARTARIEVVVGDPNADVWFGHHRTKARGLKRVFETPILQPGRPYSYEVTVQWSENGVAKQDRRRVGVQPGSTIVADFSADQVPPVPQGERQPPQPRPVR